MKSPSRGWFVVILLTVFSTITNFGCGGGSGVNHAITIAVSALANTVQAGATTQVTAIVSGDSSNRGVTWTLTCSAAPCGSVLPGSTPSNSPTTYTAPGTAPVNTLTVTVIATSVADGSITGSATITVPAASGSPTISVNPTSATVAPNATMQFTATVTNDPANAGVNWVVTCSIAQAGEQAPPSCGGLSATTTPSGTATTYTAPSVGDLNVQLTATSVTDGNVNAIANVRVQGIAILISPGSATIQVNSSGQFTATVVNDSSNQGVSWSLLYVQNGQSVACPSAAVCGAVLPTTTASGAPTTYTAPTTPPTGNQQIVIVATSVANSAASAQGFITIPGLTVSVAPNTATVEATASAQFTATVSNDPSNSGVNWVLTQQIGVNCSPGCGTINPTNTASGTATTYTAPAPAAVPQPYLAVTLTATSVTNSGASGSANVTVLPISVSVTPVSALMPLSSSQQFTATVNNDASNGGVSWGPTQGGSACSPTCGSVAPGNTASGSPTTYSAPATLPANTAVSVVATSVTDTTDTGNSAVTLTSGTAQIVPYSMDFGRVLVNTSSSPQVTTLTNTGNSVLNISGITITPSVEFSQTNTCGASIAAGGSCTITLTFKPTVRGTIIAKVSVADSSTDSPQQISLTGIGYTKGKGVAALRSGVLGTATATVPSPTGPYTVGTRVMDLTDSTRNDPYLANGAKREIKVRFWYPATLTAPCKPADYTSPRVWNYFSQLVGVPLPRVVTNSCQDAPVSRDSHPVVVFTPGYTGTFTDYTFLFEDLASRGYVVASVDHTYEATAVELPDGTLARSIFGSHLNNSWHGDEQIFNFATAVRLQDLSSVMNELQRMNVDQTNPFAGKLDMSHVAVAGHSMGGSTAILAADADRRFKAAVVIDGVLARSLDAATETPVLLLMAGHKQWSNTEQRVWAQLEGARLAVNLKGAEHVAPTDEVWLARDAIETGPMGTEKMIAAVRDYVAAFLDVNLRGQGVNPLLTGPSLHYPDVELTTQNELLRDKP